MPFKPGEGGRPKGAKNRKPGDPRKRHYVAGGYQDKYQRRREWVSALKMQRGCKDCGYAIHPHALQFDHLPGAEKSFTISTAVVSHTLDQLAAEIEKCEVVCANCHAIRTAERRRPV